MAGFKMRHGRTWQCGGSWLGTAAKHHRPDEIFGKVRGIGNSLGGPFWDQCMIDRNPERNFEILWNTFHNRYPFFELRNVDWKQQYERYRPKVTTTTTDEELFDIFSGMLDPLDDGHVELEIKASARRKRRYFNPEP